MQMLNDRGIAREYPADDLCDAPGLLRGLPGIRDCKHPHVKVECHELLCGGKLFVATEPTVEANGTRTLSPDPDSSVSRSSPCCSVTSSEEDSSQDLLSRIGSHESLLSDRCDDIFRGKYCVSVGEAIFLPYFLTLPLRPSSLPPCIFLYYFSFNRLEGHIRRLTALSWKWRHPSPALCRRDRGSY